MEPVGPSALPESFRRFPLIEALVGRRSRRVALGSEIPAGPLRFTSRHAPLPLSPVEQALVLFAASGNTGWNHLIPYCAQAPTKLPSYAGAAGGRTFPSAAGVPHKPALLHRRRGHLALRHPRRAVAQAGGPKRSRRAARCAPRATAPAH